MAYFWILIPMLTGLIYVVFFKKPKPEPELPKLDVNEWWGPIDLKGKEDTSIRPFKVEFSDDMIKDLRQRLSNHRSWTPPLEDAAFTYGFNSDHINSWLDYWKDEYNFKEREQFLNQFPQFKTNIQGLDIHFIRVKPKVPEGVQIFPLLLLHGWPGSVREFYEAIPILTRHTPGYNFAFEVIVPSLPGYGFSDAAVRTGLGTAQICVVMRNLMFRLGFKRFYVQGGDWGAGILTSMVTLFPFDILGFHCNMAMALGGKSTLMMFLGAYIPFVSTDSSHPTNVYPLSNYFSKMMEETGYFHLHCTKPDTVGIALSDSPAGLLAYILEKFSTWTKMDNRNRPDGGLSDRWTKDQLIDNLMLYWATGKITSSMRLYAEEFSKKNRDLKLSDHNAIVPMWVLQTKEELYNSPSKLLRFKFRNLVGVTHWSHGGHFPAFECPEEFAKDVFKGIDSINTWVNNLA
ncbi:hypothetical protein MSG28_012872 [Choristoneura fumiferana]|uniref:Uncharacterized protein n=1 Tax=Choristoneura fumiferana TaxID=7141 RepID=A0ACC0JIJ0_CHOFU|nr:hypothetical protein MSG28_012872 [Choristoneura fumiferana]